MIPPFISNRWRPVGALLASLMATAALAGPDRGPDHRNFPKLQFHGQSRGQEAVELLGNSLPNVAQAYGLEAFALRVMLNGDNTLAVDRSGRLHYTEPAAGAISPASGVAVQALAPLADTFLLHSRPSAKRIIYLDFNGHVLTGTAWNTYSPTTPATINAPAWSSDADPTTFNDAERTKIQYIWQRVAEDYAPFDVDVTTELTSEDQITRSSVSDQYYGSRVLISPISSYFGSYGGIAYVGAFDSIGDYYKPALVFPENLGPNGESYIAEATSHELGHNLGLGHDGTPSSGYYSGHGNWAPIMGVGYYVSIVQWSKGEYANANNLQNDLAIIAGYVGYRPDDHGNTAAAATYLLPAGNQLSAAGVITSSSDVDVFEFSTGAGVIAIGLDPDNRSGNLDILAELRDSAGSLVASSNPLGALNASFNLSLNAGTYFIHLRGTGEGSATDTGYSAYGSIGQYTIDGTVVPPGPQPPVAVATATPTVVAPTQPVTFNGTGSFDPDGGSILGYSWSFSDGSTGTGATMAKSFATYGSYTATLTVTDDEGEVGSTTVSVRVNSLPVAGISVSPGTSGFAPLALSFSGSSSTDSDGTISAYSWNFGDGTTGSGISVSKTYNNAGSYTVLLTVTDNNGATGTKTVVITATQNPALVIRVWSIGLTVQSVPGGKTVRATVKITNLNGAAVSGVNVSGQWTGLVTGSGSAVTSATGDAVITSAKTKKSGPVTFKVTGVNRSGYTYSAADSMVSSATITVP